MTIGPLSARMTAPGHTLELGPIRTSPIRTPPDGYRPRVDSRSFIAQRIESHGDHSNIGAQAGARQDAGGCSQSDRFGRPAALPPCPMSWPDRMRFGRLRDLPTCRALQRLEAVGAVEMDHGIELQGQSGLDGSESAPRFRAGR